MKTKKNRKSRFNSNRLTVFRLVTSNNKIDCRTITADNHVYVNGFFYFLTKLRVTKYKDNRTFRTSRFVKYRKHEPSS